MKVIVINCLSALRGGGQTYLINILAHLPNLDFRIILIVNSKNRNTFEKYKSKKVSIYQSKFASKNLIYRTLWERYYLQAFLSKNNASIYYAPGGIMISRMPKGVLSVTALRNMLPFDERERKRFPLMSFIRFKLWLLRFVFIYSYKKSDKVIFISEHSKSVIKNFIPKIDNKSVVIPHGLNLDFFEDKTKFNLPDILKVNQFYLYVSILDVYKAQKEIVMSWKSLKEIGFQYPLVLVGPKYNEYGEQVIDLIKSEGLENDVFYLGKVEYEKLPNLYKSARALIFASSCECCPNILLEKLSASRPVLCSNIQPMPEFAEDAAVYFDPYSPSTLVSSILQIEEDEEKMKDLGERAYKQAKKFNWNETTLKTISYLLK